MEEDSIEFHWVVWLLPKVSGSSLVAGRPGGQVATFPQGRYMVLGWRGESGKRNDQWLPAAQDNGGGGACSEQQLEANVGNPAPLSLKPRSFSVRSLFKKLAWPPIN